MENYGYEENAINLEHVEVVTKVMKMTYEEFMEFIRYLLRYSNNGAIHIIHEFFDHYIDKINQKPVSELTNEERVILMVHWAFEHGGIDKYKETPFDIIESITDAELVQEFNKRCKNPNSYVNIESHAVCSKKEV